MVIIMMGVAGTGKTTIGKRLAEDLGWPFYDGDDFHPAANVEKMAQGIALTDADRLPWIAALRGLMDDLVARDQAAIIACSALKRAYRERLEDGPGQVRFVHLHGSYDVIQQRLQARQEHFMPAALLASQFDTLEMPEDALIVDIAQPPEALVQHIKQALLT